MSNDNGVRITTQIPGEPPVSSRFPLAGGGGGFEWLVRNVEAEGGRVVSVTINGDPASALSAVRVLRELAS